MAKLVVVLSVCFLACAISSCSAYRPLLSVTEAALSTAKTDLTTANSKSSFSSSVKGTPATESGIAEQEEARTESESEESFNMERSNGWTRTTRQPSRIPLLKDVVPPCMEEDLEDSSVDGGKPCHRNLGDGTSFAMLDYGGTGHSSPNPKGGYP